MNRMALIIAAPVFTQRRKWMAGSEETLVMNPHTPSLLINKFKVDMMYIARRMWCGDMCVVVVDVIC